MAKQATAAQRRFAAEIAAGRTKKLAYALAHPQQRMNPRALRNAASQAAKSPVVQAEIARLTVDPIILDGCLGADDPTALLKHGIATMVRLSKCADPRVAMTAAEWLIEYATSFQSAPVPNPKTEREQLIGELKGLYAKALGEVPLVVETVGENEPETAPESFASAR